MSLAPAKWLLGIVFLSLTFLRLNAIDIRFSSYNGGCNYTILLENNTWTNDSSLFLFTFTPLEHDLKSVFIANSESPGVVVPLSKRYGMYSISLVGYTVPLSLQFSASTTGTGSVGVVCRQDLISSETTCEYVPTTYVSPISYQASVLHADSVSALRFALPYPALKYMATIRKNGIFSVNETESACNFDSTTSSTEVECLLSVSISTTGTSDPLLPYEAQLPLLTYSYSRASLAPTLHIINLSYLVQDSVSPQTLLTHISQFASITLDPLDSSRFVVTGPSSDPTNTPAPVTDAVITNSVTLSPAAVDWRADTPPAQSNGLGILFTKACDQEVHGAVHTHGDSAGIDSMVMKTSRNTYERHVTSLVSENVAADSCESHDKSPMIKPELKVDQFVPGVITGILVVAFEQGYRVHDMLMLNLDLPLNATDEFLSEEADCVIVLPSNITCVIKTDVPRNDEGISLFAVYSQAFLRAENLSISVTQMVPSLAAVVQPDNHPLDNTSATPVAANATHLLTKYKAFDNVDVYSFPWPELYDPMLDQPISLPYYDSSLRMLQMEIPYDLTNQLIHVEVGCLLEKPLLRSNLNLCTRIADRIYSCPLADHVVDALINNDHSVYMKKFTWHTSVSQRSSPVVFKRVLASDSRIILETSKIDIHAPIGFNFRVSNVTMTIMRENTTLTADMHSNQWPRLFYPSVDRFVLNVTAPLFQETSSTFSLTSTFTPLIQEVSETATVDDTSSEMWQLDLAAAIPLECYPVSAYAIACVLTAETATKHGRINISVAHEHPHVTPSSISVSAAIYAGTDVSTCGGNNPVQAGLTAFETLDSTNESDSVTRARAKVTGAFVTDDADIAAARKHMRGLVAQWRASRDQQHGGLRGSSLSNLSSMASVGNIGDILPADWWLACMVTTSDVHVADLWSAPATAGSTTSWALSTAVIWLWPTLGAVLLLLVVYRVYKWRCRKVVRISPIYAAPPSVTHENAAGNTLDMQANPCQSENNPKNVSAPYFVTASNDSPAHLYGETNKPLSMSLLPAVELTSVNDDDPSVLRRGQAEYRRPSEPGMNLCSIETALDASKSFSPTQAPSIQITDHIGKFPVISPQHRGLALTYLTHTAQMDHIMPVTQESIFAALFRANFSLNPNVEMPIYQSENSPEKMTKCYHCAHETQEIWSISRRSTPSPPLASISPLSTSLASMEPAHHSVCTFAPFTDNMRWKETISGDDEEEQGFIVFTDHEITRTSSLDRLEIAKEI